MTDESSWPHCGYGEAGSGICGRLSQNKNFGKGGNTIICMDSGRLRICAYTHHHKLYNHKKHIWSDAVPYKLYILQCDFLEMVHGSMSRKRKLFHDNPTTTVDNYFVTDAVLYWADNAGLGIIDKNERNRLLKYIEPFYVREDG